MHNKKCSAIILLLCQGQKNVIPYYGTQSKYNVYMTVNMKKNSLYTFYMSLFNSLFWSRIHVLVRRLELAMRISPPYCSF